MTAVEKLFDALLNPKKKQIVPSGLKLRGRFSVEHRRNDGLLGKYEFNNDIVNEGRLHILDVQFSDATQIASTGWYIGIINASGYSAIPNTDVMNSHSGWSEFTNYSQSTRVAWGPGTPSSNSITNSSPAVFTINTASATLKGVFITTGSVKGGTSGILWATALFNADVPVVSGDELKVTYTVNA